MNGHISKEIWVPQGIAGWELFAKSQSSTGMNMNMTKRILLFLFFGLFLLNAKNVFASSCTAYGNTTMCSDGTSYTQYGNTIMGSNGTSYTQYGNTTMGSNGTSCTQYGNTMMCSNGTSYTQYGNTIMGSNGSSYQTYGNTTMGSGGDVTNTCPANSTYDSSTGKCNCAAGYVSNGTSCIYSYSYPTTLTCPVNSYNNGSACTCDYGYMASGGSCITYNQNCQNQYGYNSYGNSTSCYCSTGYQWNAARTSCVATPIITCAYGSVYKNGQCISNTADCELTFGSDVVGVPGSSSNSSCSCTYGYQWNSSKTACQAIPVSTTNTVNNQPAGSGTFTSALQVGSTGAQVILLQTLLTKLGDFNGSITGYYGSVTRTAVVIYQTSRGISPTGTVGPQTRVSLNSDLSS